MNVQNNQTGLIERHRSVFRTVVAFWLMGWFIKAYFLIPYVFGEVVHYPILNNFFPAFFRDPHLLQFFYCLPIVAFVLIFKRNPFIYGVTVVCLMVSSAYLLLHQDTHNDATFLTSFWVAVWLGWFWTQMNKPDETVMVHARSLALCVIAFIFWGGFVGKLTPEYWDGTVLSNIYLSQEPNLINKLVRGHLDEGAIRLAFAWIAKAVIIMEGLLALAPLWPYRIALMLGVGLMVCISFFTTWRIFSVLLCLIGLLVACRPVKSRKFPL